MSDDIFEEEDVVNIIDVCPSCGALLTSIEDATHGCCDEMGCARFLCDEDEEDYEDEDDYGVKELDFE